MKILQSGLLLVYTRTEHNSSIRPDSKLRQYRVTERVSGRNSSCICYWYCFPTNVTESATFANVILFWIFLRICLGRIVHVSRKSSARNWTKIYSRIIWEIIQKWHMFYWVCVEILIIIGYLYGFEIIYHRNTSSNIEIQLYALNWNLLNNGIRMCLSIQINIS